MIEEICFTVNENMFIRRGVCLLLCGASVDSVILARLRFVQRSANQHGLGGQRGHGGQLLTIMRAHDAL